MAGAVSDCGGGYLGASKAGSTARQPKLKHRDPTSSTHAPRCQPLLERKLRRLARRADELARHAPHQPPLLWRKIQTAIADLPDYTHVLRPLQWGTKEAASAVFQLADEVADVYARSRLEAWKRAVQDDLHRLAKWVTAEHAPPPEGEPQAPSAVASNWAQIWEGRWLSNHFDASEAKQLCDSVIEQRPSVELTVTTDHLINAMRKSVGKAAGADAWFAADLLRLPDSFLRALLDFWNLCLDVAQLPRAWQTVRVALLPKEDGGMRPLAIASVLYRVCMTATVKALRTWSRSWLPSELYGGVEGRGGLMASTLLCSTRCGSTRILGSWSGTRQMSNAALIPLTMRRFSTFSADWGRPLD